MDNLDFYRKGPMPREARKRSGEFILEVRRCLGCLESFKVNSERPDSYCGCCGIKPDPRKMTREEYEGPRNGRIISGFVEYPLNFNNGTVKI